MTLLNKMLAFGVIFLVPIAFILYGLHKNTPGGLRSFIGDNLFIVRLWLKLKGKNNDDN